MIIFPQEKPILNKLNSYYVQADKLVEHCQGEFGSGIIQFDSPKAKGVVFFDVGEVLNGAFENTSSSLNGQQAIDKLLRSDEYNFSISVYHVAPELIDFWAQMPMSENIYKEQVELLSDLLDTDLVTKWGYNKL